MKDNMETSMYKELSYRVRGFRAVTCIIAAVTVVLCLLIGLGTWVLVSGVRDNEKYLNGVTEHDITIIEGEIREPLSIGQKSSTNNLDKVIQHINEMDFKAGVAKDVDQPEIVQPVPLQKTNQQVREPIPAEPEVYVDPYAYKTTFAHRYIVVPKHAESEENIQEEEEKYTIPEMILIDRQKKNSPSMIDTLVQFTNNLRAKVLANPAILNNPNLQYIEKTFRSLGDYANQVLGYEEPATHRSERSVAPMMIGNALKYASYAAFAKFMYNEASAITEYKIESRKLSGDPEANFLDNIFWSKPNSQNPSRIDIVEPSSQEISESQNKPLTYGSDNWEPMVNQVSLDFMSELLNTLLKIMREFLLRDHVMECLWFMFCQDVNHQAKYSDIYGVMARVNSVGLKVLTDREERETDTIGDIWRAISAFSPLHCDVMFPKCDGSKALEIVNDVASGSN